MSKIKTGITLFSLGTPYIKGELDLEGVIRTAAKLGAEGYEIVAINDLTSPKMLAHLLKYDSSQGKYALADTVSATDDSIIVDGKEIKIYAKANAAELPW